MHPASDANDYDLERTNAGLTNTEPPQRIRAKGTDYLINASDTAYVRLDGLGRTEEIVLVDQPSATAVLREYKYDARMGIGDWLKIIAQHAAFFMIMSFLISLVIGYEGGVGFMVMMTPVSLLISIIDGYRHAAKVEEPHFVTTITAHNHARFFLHAGKQDTEEVRQLLHTRHNERLNDSQRIDLETQLSEILTSYSHHHLPAQQRAQLVQRHIDDVKLEIERENKLAELRREEQQRVQEQLQAEQEEQRQREITDTHQRLLGEQAITAGRQRRQRLREQARGQWNDIIARHQQLRQEYLDSEMNPETLLTLPTLRDMSDVHTKAMIQAMTRANNTSHQMPDYLSVDADPDIPVLDIHTEPYVQRVEAFDAAWATALANAEKIGLDLIPASERKTIATIEKLLAQAKGGGVTDEERKAFYSRAHTQLQSLTHVRIPDAALVEIESLAAGMLEA